ncbi:hypothetical protein [Streptomyces litchfieldiae]|uniref:Uncharacterized protein n=1 Tax=Streptomyces litchfieldiae TaxID=3075543 RepID=A0ABU2MXR4_9ACTN|nr:hypothetical protein [Streptomyces sp. DSM 44938]MDT0346445.1 hypothetical protein [Streptomyces sp. DSM 44938]
MQQKGDHAEQPTAAETELADLTTTRATLLRITGADDPPSADATLASTAYQQILAVFTTTGDSNGLRAKDICPARSASTPPPTTLKACTPNSNASSPAASSPNANPNPACSPSPGPRPAALTQSQRHTGHSPTNHPLR